MCIRDRYCIFWYHLLTNLFLGDCIALVSLATFWVGILGAITGTQVYRLKEFFLVLTALLGVNLAVKPSFLWTSNAGSPPSMYVILGLIASIIPMYSALIPCLLYTSPSPRDQA
eukprot:TRINITY_DN3802_c0_g1_i2.p2 TRINITY_DN3802_c0_g1~~TRINITY_DN3802_c0_g1_i2.p2  ORF type:complete len:134 (+),score=25.96 TRINITY_DN3802_c0_g1_i2:62-403(+)